jgi:hypothetical protein
LGCNVGPQPGSVIKADRMTVRTISASAAEPSDAAKASPSGRTPLDRFAVVRTHSIDQMRDVLSKVYAQPQLLPVGSTRMLAARVNNFVHREVRLHFIKYGADVRVRFPETGWATLILPARGSGELVIGKATIPMPSGSGRVVSPGVAFGSNLDMEFERLGAMLQRQALMRKLAAITGAPARGPLDSNRRWTSSCRPHKRCAISYSSSQNSSTMPSCRRSRWRN